MAGTVQARSPALKIHGVSAEHKGPAPDRELVRWYATGGSRVVSTKQPTGCALS